jgi:Zn-dependent protease
MFLETLFKDPILFLRIVVILIISIVIHELAHGVAALSQGDDTPRTAGHLTIDPVVHMGYESLIFLCVTGMAWGAMPVNPGKFRHHRWSDIVVSAAGPLSNLVLGSLCMVIYVIALQGLLPISPKFFLIAAHTNMVLFIFNLIPIPPLDGFNVCAQLFPKLGLEKFRNHPAALFGLMLLFLLPGTSMAMSIGSRFLMTNVAHFIRLMMPA